MQVNSGPVVFGEINTHIAFHKLKHAPALHIFIIYRYLVETHTHALFLLSSIHIKSVSRVFSHQSLPSCVSASR